jgi:hypothetical protein
MLLHDWIVDNSAINNLFRIGIHGLKSLFDSNQNEKIKDNIDESRNQNL